MKKYYTYIHYKKDTKIPFYVGIGTQRTKKSESFYSRAKTKSKRNFLWYTIINSCNGFDWEVIFESDLQYEVKAKEIELINLYGRKDIHTGILCNMTGGGDGRLNGESSTYDTNKKNLDKYREARKKKCYQYSLEGKFIKEWNSISEASRYLNLSSNSGILQCLQGKMRHAYDFIWRYVKEEKPVMKIKITGAKKIKQYDLEGSFIKEHNSLLEASLEVNGSFKAISRCALGLSKSSKGFVWIYS